MDIDTHQDGSVWLDHDLPEPTWTIWTDRGVQFIWQLKKPVLAEVRQHRAYAIDTLRKIVYALDADTDAIGYTRIFRNPFTNESRQSDSVVDLSDFNHLDPPPRAWVERSKPRVISLLDNKPTIAENVDFSTMREGDGRNTALFDRLRFWAYEQARADDYSEFDLAEKGFTLNSLFAEPMHYKEVDQIIASIDHFIETNYKRSTYMANTTPEERKKIARKNGEKGGKSRRAEAYGRILATINQMQSFDIKITVSELARRAKSDRKTVRSYLIEKGWNEVSRKEGWKLIKKEQK